MRFNNQNTINEILADEGIKKCIGAFFPESILYMIPDEYLSKPITVVGEEVMMPWGGPFMADDFLNAANQADDIVKNHSFKFISLWEEHSEAYIPDMSKNDETSVSLMVKSTCASSCVGKNRPAVIICPGGGYRVLSGTSEGVEFAEKMEEAGYVPFILYYRLAPNQFPKPQDDLVKAIQYVRTHADEYGVDPDDLMLMGSSAGAHLCASVAMLEVDTPNCPNKLCLNYPVINFQKEMHEDSALALVGNDSKLMDMLSVDQHITPKYPKTFLWACEDDLLVPPSNSVRMADALKEKGVEYEFHLYPQGGHGCGLAIGTSAEGWMDEMLKFMNGFSPQSTIKEITNIPELGEINKYLMFDNNLDIGQGNDFYDLTLEFMRPIGWSPEGIIKGINHLVQQVENGAKLYRVYAEEDRKADPAKEDVTIVRLIPEEIDPKKPVMILVPGGGYTAVSVVVEAYPAAADFVNCGYQVFVMTYRIGGFGQFPKPMEDVAQVIRFIFSHSVEFDIDTNEYVLNGYSAGGNLVCTFGTRENGYEKYGLQKPKAILPIYGVLRVKEFAHKNMDIVEDMLKRMFGEHYKVSDIEKYDIMSHLDEEYPPCYAVHGLADSLSELESEKYLKEGLDRHNIPCVVETIPTAGHGFGDGTGTDAAGWVERAVDFIEKI
ncbi:MAG: alpha/beta hydrolase [Hespellia sp.]|nr:alpha/beta hydrolase [Hespellia sp.]